MIKITNRYNVLVVEDNPGDYYLIKDHLEDTEIVNNLYWSQDFASVANDFAELEGQLDIIFLDLSLPDKEGEDLLTEIRKLVVDKPLIILTDYADANFAVKSLSLGASDYLLKDVISPTILHKSMVYNMERTRILKTLRESEKRYADLFHFSPLPLVVFDKFTLEILDANDAFLSHYGYSVDDFEGRKLTEIMEEDSLTTFNNRLVSARGKNFDIKHRLQNHKKKNGELIEVEVRSNSYEYEGRPAEILSINDVTERNRQIKAIEQQNEALKDIAWTQSHIVRAPVARIMGIINGLKSDSLQDDEREILCANILKSAEELDEIIRSVVDKSQQVTIKGGKK